LDRIAKGDFDGCTKVENGPRSETWVQADSAKVATVKQIQGEPEERSPRLKVSQSMQMVPDRPDETAGVALLMEAIGTNDPDLLC
jgi:hypothetical protein